MKVKCGYIAVLAGVITLLGGLMLKEKCTKCGSFVFGFGLAHVFLGVISLLKGESGVLPDKISIPMGNLEIDLK